VALPSRGAERSSTKGETLKLQNTLVLLKPDAVQRGLVGEIISRLEARGLKIVGMKLIQMSREMALRHYNEHQGKPFFDGLVGFITSGPIVALALEGENAVDLVRRTMGVTSPLDSDLGTIRGDLAIDIGRNLIHGSDSPESARRELELFFADGEILNYKRDADAWITEA
jgi:nucleoside-diphosphate kinase